MAVLDADWLERLLSGVKTIHVYRFQRLGLSRRSSFNPIDAFRELSDVLETIARVCIILPGRATCTASAFPHMHKLVHVVVI